MVGELIVFEGVDASGKETQSRLLTNYLRDRNKTVAYFTFPNYASWSGQRIKRWLNKSLDLNQYEANMLYSLNRYESKETLEQCIRDYDYVILDRYYYSNWVYGNFREKMDNDWLRSLDKNLPKPSKVILLCISGKLSAERRGSIADIHEINIDFLDSCNREYQILGHRLGWHILDGSDLPEKIHARICANFSPKLTV